MQQQAKAKFAAPVFQLKKTSVLFLRIKTRAR